MTTPPPTATILVVDDDPEVREIVSDILLDYGHQVLAAGGGSEALRLIEATPRSPSPNLPGSVNVHPPPHRHHPGGR